MLYKEVLTLLLDRQDLPHDVMAGQMRALMGGEYAPEQIAGFLVALRMKGESVAEIVAAAEVMRELSTKVILPDIPNLVDTCGTGGDGMSTFNISTAAAFVAAACGVNVAKHGGRAVSSSSGSADVLASLGANINLTPESVAESIKNIGVGFMFALNHHGAMKHAAQVRKSLGVRTMFNLLGPLTNPAGAPNQVLGVYSQRLTFILANVLSRLGSRHVLVVYAKEGLDEISLASTTQVAELKNGSIHEYQIEPESLGFPRVPTSELVVRDTISAHEMLLAALENRHPGASAIVAANAGAAIYVSGKAESLKEGVQQAKEAISSGAAKEKLMKYIKQSNQL